MPLVERRDSIHLLSTQDPSKGPDYLDGLGSQQDFITQQHIAYRDPAPCQAREHEEPRIERPTEGRNEEE